MEQDRFCPGLIRQPEQHPETPCYGQHSRYVSTGYPKLLALSAVNKPLMPDGYIHQTPKHVVVIVGSGNMLIH